MTCIGKHCHADYRCVMATTTMNISLTEALKDFVDAEVRSGGYSSASEYVRELLRERMARQSTDRQLLAAIRSEDLGELTPEFFEGLRDRVRKGAKKKAPAKGGR